MKNNSYKFEKPRKKSKCGTLDNIGHKAGGGDIEIFHEKLPWKEENEEMFESHSGSGL